MKKVKILPLAMIICILLSAIKIMPVSAESQSKVSAAMETWKEDALIYPAQEQLIPAGPIWVKWNTIPGAANYIMYLDDKSGEVVYPSSNDTLEYEVYTTDVGTHTVWVEAELTNGQKILSKPRTFYVSKKGIGYFNDLSNMKDMNLSWYYTWNAKKSNDAAVKDLDFTPMFWNGQCYPEQIGDDKTVLGCNEPDHTGQVNTPATTVARNWWPSFVNSGKRIGSPAAAWEYENKPGQWLYDFMELIKQPDGSYPVDFIAIHDYPGWPGDTDGGDQIANFKALIEDLWNRYHKPIWITEFAVANWPSNQDDIQSWGYTKQHVYDYMDKLTDYLDTCPYVERYAWFSFGDPDGNPSGENAGSHAALTNRSTGDLTRLGELYRDKGNPQRLAVSDHALPPALGGDLSCVINVTAGTGGTITGGGAYNYNTQVTLTATPNEHYIFDGWYEGDTLLSGNTAYVFTALGSQALQAKFKIDPNDPPPLPKIHLYDPDDVFGNSAFVYSGVWTDQWLEMCGPWPGIPLQKEDGWFTFEMDLSTIATFILNDGSSDSSTQLKYVWNETMHNSNDLYFVVDKDAFAYSGDGGSKDHYLTQYDSKEAALLGGGTPPGGPVLNIYDPTNQLGDNPHWYGLDTNWWDWPAGTYPGSAIQKSTDGWLSLEYDINVLNAIIFNNGTEDAKYVWSRDRHKFNEYWLVIDPTTPQHAAENGSVERYLIPYTSKEDALKGGGSEPEEGRGGPVIPTANVKTGIHKVNVNAIFDSGEDSASVSTISDIKINGISLSTAPAGVSASNGVDFYFNLVEDGDAKEAKDNGTDQESDGLAVIPVADKIEIEVKGKPSAFAQNGALAGMTSGSAYNEIINNWGGSSWFGINIFDGRYVPDQAHFTVNGDTLTISVAIPIQSVGSIPPTDPEPQVPEVTNVAKDKTVWTNKPGEGKAENGIDGNSDTRFESEHGSNYELTYTIDLAEEHLINKIDIDWEAMSTAATRFKIETATDADGPWTSVYTKDSGEAEMNFSTSFDSVKARYVTLTATEKEGHYGYSFWEFEVYGAKTGASAPSGDRTNVALGKTADTNSPGGGSAQNGIDGDVNTRFESVHGDSYEMTYTIDLEDVYSIDEIKIGWETEATAATKYKIEAAASENGPWTTVYTKDGGAAIQNMSEQFEAVHARYVKLTAYEKTGQWGYSFWEFEVYGK